MSFVKVHPGGFIHIDTVREVRKGPDENYVTLRTDRDGERLAKKSDWEAACVAATSHILPAAPGTFHVFYFRVDEDTIEFGREPVLAWVVQDRQVVPMTLNKTFDGLDDAFAIEFPGGTVQSHDGIYQSLESWAAEMRDAENPHIVISPETIH
jgi:hypothetical protein